MEDLLDFWSISSSLGSIMLGFLLTHQDSVFLPLVKSFRGTRISSTMAIINTGIGA
jgi:hypothetical protein